jgi:hypothetical protein
MRAFMKRHNLTRRELADSLDTSPHTLRGWLDQAKTPPASLGPLLALIEEKPQVRSRLGLSRGRKFPRGRPFERGHAFRFGDPRREAALREARERKQGKTK